MSQRCALICCPNCGYQMPDEAKTHVVSWLRRRLARLSSVSDLWPSQQTSTADHCPLSRLPAGTTAQVAAIQSARPARLERLSLLGIVPGSQVRLEQRWPAIVVRVGETELSLDEDVADQIIVTLRQTSR
jgi:Fe2+ transport system protein FeoA